MYYASKKGKRVKIYFFIANFAPQTEHVPFSVIIGALSTVVPQSPHFAILSPQIHIRTPQINNFRFKTLKETTCPQLWGDFRILAFIFVVAIEKLPL
jgi:hypothetical protein